jgi:tetratricopeptide (TPR) repeat protein
MSPFPIVLSSLLLTSVDAPTQPEGIVEASEGPAELDDNGPPSEAVEAFRRGRTLYANAEYQEALAAFRRADSLHPAADLQYNIALCHMRLHNWAEAITGFEIYLRTKDNPADRADVEARIAEARRNLARTQLAAETREQVIAPPPTSAVPSEPTTMARDRPSPPERPWAGLIASGSVLLGLGAAGAIGGAAGFGVALASKNDEIDAIVNGGNPRGVGYAEARQLEDDAEKLRTYQWVTVGVGSAVAVTGAVLLGVGLKRRKDARRKTVAMHPLVGPAVGGLAVGGRF